MNTQMRLIGTPQCVQDIGKQFENATRNLYPMNADMPRSTWPGEVDRVLSLQELPPGYKNSPIWQHAHSIAELSRSIQPLAQ